ncbi:MAG: hypothetical protein CM1200mP41_21190 [Gammaproteobacteria bacterium]|nr:MAG: hypothetical protein CM1200mP41_21190 [Gammaproteobacteria bacterium]
MLSSLAIAAVTLLTQTGRKDSPIRSTGKFPAGPGFYLNLAVHGFSVGPGKGAHSAGITGPSTTVSSKYGIRL